MTIYSLYIYDRHCECVFYHDWQRTKRPRPSGDAMTLPGVTRQSMLGPRNALTLNSGVVVASNDPSSLPASQATGVTSGNSGLPFDEEAKLVYGVVISLRNMIKKLSGKDDNFVNYRTSTYKLHLYETVSNYKFVMLTDPNATADALRFVLRQIYTGPFIEFVVRNPLVNMDSRENGIDNDHFRSATDKLVRNFSIFN